MGTITYQIPQSGQPNATEDAKVSSALTALLTLVNGNIDGTNLAPGTGNYTFVGASGSLPATDGHLYGCAPGTTLTLVAVQGAMIVAQANGAVTGANPVTISAGANFIYAPGSIGGTSSVLLGTGFASATFYCTDGVSWAIIAGRHDTGWVPLVLDPNITVTGGAFTPAARRQGDMIQLRGSATNNTGGNKFGNWATAPVGLRPAAQVVMPVAFSPSTVGDLVANTAGGLGSTTVVANGGTVNFDGLVYSSV